MIANREGGDGVKPSEWTASRERLRGSEFSREGSSGRPPFRGTHDDSLGGALERSTEWLLARQYDEGHWVAELEGDTILESEYILLLAFLGLETDPVCAGMARYIRDHQREDGGWAIYPGGPTDVSASVKAYFALKLTGADPDELRMVRARQAILDAGGAGECNSFTRFYLALLGQISYDECPCVPPELVLLPSWLNFSLSAMSAWTRTIVVPLTIMSFYKPVRRLSPEQGIAELFCGDRPARERYKAARFSWTSFFLGMDRTLKWLDRRLPAAWRNPGLRAAKRWMLAHCENTDGLGAIFPPMVYSIIAFRCLGYELDSPEVKWALEQLRGLQIAQGDRGACAALSLAGVGHRHRDDLPGGCGGACGSSHLGARGRVAALEGDTAPGRLADSPEGGRAHWLAAFQFHNAFYPKILDDTAMVLLAASRSPLAIEPDTAAAVSRGVDWLLAMQNRDGGWAAYDVRHR